jgi:hypothetical protein
MAKEKHTRRELTRTESDRGLPPSSIRLPRRDRALPTPLARSPADLDIFLVLVVLAHPLDNRRLVSLDGDLILGVLPLRLVLARIVVYLHLLLEVVVLLTVRIRLALRGVSLCFFVFIFVRGARGTGSTRAARSAGFGCGEKKQRRGGAVREMGEEERPLASGASLESIVQE